MLGSPSSSCMLGTLHDSTVYKQGQLWLRAAAYPAKMIASAVVIGDVPSPREPPSAFSAWRFAGGRRGRPPPRQRARGGGGCCAGRAGCGDGHPGRGCCRLPPARGTPCIRVLTESLHDCAHSHDLASNSGLVNPVSCCCNGCAEPNNADALMQLLYSGCTTDSGITTQHCTEESSSSRQTMGRPMGELCYLAVDAVEMVRMGGAALGLARECM